MSNIPAANFFATRGERVYVQAQLIWIILIGIVENEKLKNETLAKRITFGDLALKMGYSDARAGHTLGNALGIVGHFCAANDLPPLNVIVVNKETQMPGDEVVTRPGKTIFQEQNAVMDYNWYGVRVPTTGTFRKVWEAMS